METNAQAVLLINGKRTGNPIPCNVEFNPKKGAVTIDRELRFPATKGGCATVLVEWRDKRGQDFLFREDMPRPLAPGDTFVFSP